MKTCKKCKRQQDESQYYVRHNEGGRLYAQCKTCMNAKHSSYYDENSEQIKLKARQWQYNNYERHRKIQQNYYKRHRAYIVGAQQFYRDFYKDISPEKIKARAEVFKAIRNGTLKRPDKCSMCGKRCKPDAHHQNYSQPLNVIFWCRECHIRHHREV